MKYFFGIDTTDKTKESRMDGVTFISRRLPQSQQRALDDLRDKLAVMEKKARLPLALSILKTVGMLLAMLIFVSLLRSLGKVTFSQAYENAPWVFWSGGIGAAVWAVLALVDYLMGKRVKGTEEYQYIVGQVERILASTYDLLGVPQSAIPVDVLSMQYSCKDGKMKRATMRMTDYINLEMKVFADEEALYLADVETVYAVARTDLAVIRKVNKRVSIPGWNKPVAYNKGMFKEYKLTANKYGHIFMKPYYQLVIRRDGQEYALEFPPYELPTFQKLTGQQVVEGISA